MAARAGKDAKVKIDTKSMAGTNDWSIPEAIDMIDITSHQDEYRKFIAGLSSWTVRISAYFDNADDAQAAILAARASKNEVIVECFLDATYYLTGYALVTGIDVSAPFAGVVSVTYSLQGSGGLSLEP
jgi:predicted secreted protein